MTDPMLERIAFSFGITYEELTADFQRVEYSVVREKMLFHWRQYWRQHRLNLDMIRHNLREAMRKANPTGERYRTGCPRCGDIVWRDDVDVGVGRIYGPYGCSCGWSEDDEYDLTTRDAGPDEKGGYIDQWGGYHPAGSPTAMAYRLADSLNPDNYALFLLASARKEQTQFQMTLDAVKHNVARSIRNARVPA